MTTPHEPVKPGYKTTEGIATAAVLVAGWVSVLAGSLPTKYALYGSAVAAGLYAVGRGLAKIGKPGA